MGISVVRCDLIDIEVLDGCVAVIEPDRLTPMDKIIGDGRFDVSQFSVAMLAKIPVVVDVAAAFRVPDSQGL